MEDFDYTIPIYAMCKPYAKCLDIMTVQTFYRLAQNPDSDFARWLNDNPNRIATWRKNHAAKDMSTIQGYFQPELESIIEVLMESQASESAIMSDYPSSSEVAVQAGGDYSRRDIESFCLAIPLFLFPYGTSVQIPISRDVMRGGGDDNYRCLIEVGMDGKTCVLKVTINTSYYDYEHQIYHILNRALLETAQPKSVSVVKIFSQQNHVKRNFNGSFTFKDIVINGNKRKFKISKLNLDKTPNESYQLVRTIWKNNQANDASSVCLFILTENDKNYQLYESYLKSTEFQAFPKEMGGTLFHINCSLIKTLYELALILNFHHFDLHHKNYLIQPNLITYGKLFDFDLSYCDAAPNLEILDRINIKSYFKIRGISSDYLWDFGLAYDIFRFMRFSHLAPMGAQNHNNILYQTYDSLAQLIIDLQIKVNIILAKTKVTPRPGIIYPAIQSIEMTSEVRNFNAIIDVLTDDPTNPVVDAKGVGSKNFQLVAFYTQQIAQLLHQKKIRWL